MQVKNDYDEDGKPIINKLLPLEHDETLQMSKFSHVNKQTWLFKKSAGLYKIYTQHGNNYFMCKKNNDSKVYISNNTSLEANVSIIPYGSSTNTYEIKLNQSNLYLTASGNDIIWSTYSNTNHMNQIWILEEKPANIHNGVDTVDELTTQTVNCIKQGGEEFVIKYYAAYSSTNKILKDVEKQRLHDAGLKIIVIYQGMGNAPEYFSDSLGVENATTALQLAKELNQPEGSAIYFAVDYNVTQEAEIENIVDYFNAIQRTFNGKYKIGIYGNGKICNRIKQKLGIAQFSWLSQSTGHSEYSAYDTPQKYDIKQSEQVYYNGVTFDNDVAVGNDYGQW